MSTLKNSLTIPRDVGTENDLDFEHLRRIGIRYIASIGGGLWTDYNEHDPGITILEMLGYAITDLGNRLQLPMADLLTGPEGSAALSAQFYKAQEILPNRAVTAADYRKLFLDIDGVRNCWIVPFGQKVYANCETEQLSYTDGAFTDTPQEFLTDFTLKGLNRIVVDYDVADDDPDRAAKIALLKQEIGNVYHANRNLCEDLVDVVEVEEQGVSVCAKIDLENNADEDEVNARIYFAIHSYFSPSVRFHSLKEMLSRGFSMDEIFEGPLLESGFIDDAELAETGLRNQVRLSDIIRLIMDIPGVRHISEITMGNCGEANDPDTWLICIAGNKRPVLCETSNFNYRKDLLPATVNEERSQSILAALKAEADAYDDSAAIGMFPALPSGEYPDTEWYETVQNDFPDTYGISPEGLAPEASTARRAQAKQLKAYLLFFDQVLATYFAQLGKARELLSVDPKLKATAFTQAVKGIPGLNGIVQNYPETDDEALGEILFAGLTDNEAQQNLLLDHLLSRFAEKFSTYAFLLKKLYGTRTNEMSAWSKKRFLSEYVSLGSARGLGFNYWHRPANELWNTDNVSGAEKRIARLSGIVNFNRRNLADNPYTDIYEPTAGTFKWRIRNGEGTAVIWSAVDHTSYDRALDDLLAAVLALIETPEDAIEKAFESGIVPNQVIGNVQVKISGSSNYYFNVVDPLLSPADPAFVTAKQLLYFGSAALLRSSLLATVRFMKYGFTQEGMFLVEHILLRPFGTDAGPEQFMAFCADDCPDNCCGIDPYSFRVSIVLPGYTQRFADPDFRTFMERLIREELPAHVVAKICWIGSDAGETPQPDDNQLLTFETLYKAWLEAKSPMGADQPMPELRDLIGYMITLNTIYPEGRLHDCDSDDYTGDIVLDRSRLGTIN
jgi:uncharacterized protein